MARESNPSSACLDGIEWRGWAREVDGPILGCLPNIIFLQNLLLPYLSHIRRTPIPSSCFLGKEVCCACENMATPAQNQSSVIAECSTWRQQGQLSKFG